MCQKFGTELPPDQMPNLTGEGLLGNVAPHMLLSSGNKKASKKIIGMMCKQNLTKKDPLFAKCLKYGINVTPQQFYRFQKNPLKLQQLLAQVQAHENMVHQVALDPTLQGANGTGGPTFNSLGQTHMLINDPRTRSITEVCRKLQVSGVDFSAVKFGDMTTQ